MATVLLLAPGIIAAGYYCYLKKLPLKSIEFFIFSATFIFIINLFVCTLIMLMGHKAMLSSDLFAQLKNVVLYGFLAAAGMVLMPNILVFASRIHLGKKHE